MSEQGWRGFLAADDIDDWVVLHGGATAAFAVPSIGDAARFGESIAAAVGDDDSVAITITNRRLTVRLTRDLWQLESRHVDLARTISTIAHAHRAQAEPSAVHEIQLAIAARPHDIDLGFWRAVLGYRAAADDNVVDPLGHGSTVWMQELDAAKPLRHAMHVDVSVAREEAERRLAAALEAGGRIVDDSEAPRWWTLSDRAGNRVCIASWPNGSE
jgi:4a-hydroxytetrahydrobiopterin dehydratase